MDFGDDRIDDAQVEIEPWFAVWSPDGSWAGQPERQQALIDRIGATFGDRAYIATGADVVPDELHVGARTYIAKGCQIRDRVTIGDDTSLNPHVTCAGTVRIGNGVRIASHAALYGFNHTFDDLDTPIWMQPLTSSGIVIEDDVWIGTHVVVCDGVTVGAHSVVAAGAIVTRDVPPWSVVAGAPARVIRDRRDPTRRLEVQFESFFPERIRLIALERPRAAGVVDEKVEPVAERKQRLVRDLLDGIAADPSLAFRIAGWYWQTHSLNQYADGSYDGFVTITRRINGGTNGLSSRLTYWERAKAQLGA